MLTTIKYIYLKEKRNMVKNWKKGGLKTPKNSSLKEKKNRKEERGDRGIAEKKDTIYNFLSFYSTNVFLITLKQFKIDKSMSFLF